MSVQAALRPKTVLQHTACQVKSCPQSACTQSGKCVLQRPATLQKSLLHTAHFLWRQSSTITWGSKYSACYLDTLKTNRQPQGALSAHHQLAPILRQRADSARLSTHLCATNAISTVTAPPLSSCIESPCLGSETP